MERKHSEKPPRIYKTTAAVIQRVSERRSLATVLSDLDSRRLNVNAIYALSVETMKREQQLNQFFDEISLFVLEPRMDPWMARVLFTELYLGRKDIQGTSKPVITAKKLFESHGNRLRSIFQSPDSKDSCEAVKPRYVRINTLKLDVADAVRTFQEEGYSLVRCTSKSYDDYLNQLKNLKDYEFISDYHVKVLFAFPNKTSFLDSSYYINGEILLQDKATCLAGLLLAPEPQSTILDMCAAPGMKTTHLASIIKNKGKIYSVEQDEERFKILNEFIKKSGATCVEVINRDALTITKTDCPDVDYILVDPSCSGSGIKRIINNDYQEDLKSGRLKKLSAFQAKLLKHALSEFKAKRIVYSTCSLYPEENEEVIEYIMKGHDNKYKLISAVELLNGWKNKGNLKYINIGEKCLYAKPENDFTDGFFIAIFERKKSKNKVINELIDSTSLQNKILVKTDDTTLPFIEDEYSKKHNLKKRKSKNIETKSKRNKK